MRSRWKHDRPMSRTAFDRRFADEAACARWLAELRWPGGFVCPGCGVCKGWELDTKPFTWECSGCHRQTSVTAGTVIRPHLIWAKERLVMGRGNYHWQHEPCWYAVRGTGHWTGDRKQTTLWQIPTRAQDLQDAATVHGTQKPVECMRRPLANNSSPGQAVYEPFSGSGTTIIAAVSYTHLRAHETDSYLV